MPTSTYLLVVLHNCRHWMKSDYCSHVQIWCFLFVWSPTKRTSNAVSCNVTCCISPKINTQNIYLFSIFSTLVSFFLSFCPFSFFSFSFSFSFDTKKVTEVGIWTRSHIGWTRDCARSRRASAPSPSTVRFVDIKS